MKKVLSFLLATTLIATMIAGCASTQNRSSAPASSDASSTTSNASQTTTGQPQVLKLWDVIVREPHPIARDKVIKAFEAANPGVTVEVTTLTGDINQKILTASAGKTLPDLMFVWNPSDVVTWGQMGITTPVDDVINEYGKDWWLSQKQLDLYKMDEKTWGVPIVTFPIAFWYRADWFKEAGLEVPKTWDEWYTVAKALTKDVDGDSKIDRYGSVLGIAEGWPFSDIRGSNADYWWDEKGDLTFSERSVETLDFLRKLFDDTCYPGSVSYQNEGQRLGFLSDQGATMVTSISFLNTVIEEKGLSWFTDGHVGVAPIPMNATADEGAGASAATHAIGVVDGQNVDLAKDFLRFWLSEESLNTYFSNNIPGHLPPYRVVWESADFQKAHEPYWDVYLSGKEIIANTQWFHPTAKWEALFGADGGASKDVMAAVTVQRQSSQEIIENLKKIAEKAKAEIE